MKSRKKGFTLLELMIVVVILGVLALLAVPALLNAVEESKNSVVTGNLSAAASSISSRVAINNAITVADLLTTLNASGSNPINDAQPAYVNGACGAGQVGITANGGGSFTLTACDADAATIMTKTIVPSTAATTNF